MKKDLDRYMLVLGLVGFTGLMVSLILLSDYFEQLKNIVQAIIKAVFG